MTRIAVCAAALFTFAMPALAGPEAFQPGTVVPDYGKVAMIEGAELPADTVMKVAFDIDSPMTEENYVKAVHILADGNPEPEVATFNFSPAMGACYATTRMRLSKTQKVYVVAAFSDGSYGSASATVKVTIGGCGG